MRKKIAAGSVYRKTYTDRSGRARRSKTWYLKFYVNGEPIEASTGTTDYEDAVALLRQKTAAAAHKSYSFTDDVDRVMVNQLMVSSSKITVTTSGTLPTTHRKESTNI